MTNRGFWQFDTPGSPNNLNASLIQRGTLAERPGSALEGQSYIATDINTLYQYTSGNWQVILAGVVPGTLIDFAGASIPGGFLLCDGRAVSRDTYSALFNAIGTTWGAGDGSTTFNIPDFRGRTSIGVDGTAGRMPADLSDLGESGGSSAVTLSIAQLAEHNHAISISSHTHGIPLGGGDNQGSLTDTRALTRSRNSVSSSDSTTPAGSFSGNSNMTGGNSSVSLVQPSAVVNKIIKT